MDRRRRGDRDGAEIIPAGAAADPMLALLLPPPGRDQRLQDLFQIQPARRQYAQDAGRQ